MMTRRILILSVPVLIRILFPIYFCLFSKHFRLILADTQELHERIADLEKALAVAHAKTSDQPHILLQTAYLFAPKDRRVPPPPSQTTPAPVHPGSPTGSHITELHDGDDSHDERDDNPNDEDDEGMGWNRPSNGKGKLSALDGVVKREPGWEPGGKVRLFKPEDENEALGEISLGTLTIGNDGEAQYVGNAAGSSFFHVSLWSWALVFNWLLVHLQSLPNQTSAKYRSLLSQCLSGRNRKPRSRKR